MAKIHTHYDNLKVSRQAPQEVIRAAYKALSQKYHPDKNPGDEKAARIMAILNSAYETLSDPVRRKEHDDWIASEEWEVEWLESTHEDGERRPEQHQHQHHQQQQWSAEPVRQPRRYSALRDPRLWGVMVVVLAVGCVLGALAASRPALLPVALAGAVDPHAGVNVVPASASIARPEPAANPAELADEWASAQGAPDNVPRTSVVRALGVTQLVVPEQVPDCEYDLYTLSAPNGEPWPQQTGYIDGYPMGNRGEGMQLVVDNSANAAPVFVKVHDLDRRSNVRHVYIRGRETMTIENLEPGKYEVRYQNIEIGSTPAECVGRRKAQALQQADAASVLALPEHSN